MGGGGGASNLRLLVAALAREFPQDYVEILCHPTSSLARLEPLNNLTVRTLPGHWPAEANRLAVGAWGLQREAARMEADVIWSVNLGAYRRGKVAQVISLHNPQQVYPWPEVAPHYPGSRLALASLRWFTVRSLRASDGIIVQTPLMSQKVLRLHGGNARFHVIPKPLESEAEVVPEPLPLSLAFTLGTEDSQRPFTFLYVATAALQKNHAVLVDAFQRMRMLGRQARLVS